jgi:hypothetical protein
MAFTNAYRKKLDAIRKTRQFEPAAPLAPGFTRTSNTMSMTGYVDKPTVAEREVWAVVKGVLGFDVIHKPTGGCIVAGVRKDRALTILDIMAELAPNFQHDAKMSTQARFDSDADELLTFAEGYTNADRNGEQDEFLQRELNAIPERHEIRQEFSVTPAMAAVLDYAVADLAKMVDPKHYVSEYTTAQCWDGHKLTLRNKDNPMRIADGLRAFAGMAKNAQTEDRIRALADVIGAMPRRDY